MYINEEYIEDIDLQQDKVEVQDDGKGIYPYVLSLKTSVIPKGRSLIYYFDNIMKMNRVIDKALAVAPMLDDYDPDYEILRLADGKMGYGDKEIKLDDGHRFFDDPNRIDKHGRSMEYRIRINIRLERLSQMRKFLLFMWNVLLKAIDVSFKAQTSA